MSTSNFRFCVSIVRDMSIAANTARSLSAAKPVLPTRPRGLHFAKERSLCKLLWKTFGYLFLPSQKAWLDSKKAIASERKNQQGYYCTFKRKICSISLAFAGANATAGAAAEGAPSSVANWASRFPAVPTTTKCDIAKITKERTVGFHGRQRISHCPDFTAWYHADRTYRDSFGHGEHRPDVRYNLSKSVIAQ